MIFQCQLTILCSGLKLEVGEFSDTTLIPFGSGQEVFLAFLSHAISDFAVCKRQEAIPCEIATVTNAVKQSRNPSENR